MRNSFYFRLVCLLFIAGSMLFAGCGGQQAGAGGQGDEVTITFWHSLVASTRPALAELIERFEEEHPNINIEEQYVPSGNALIQKLITAVQSNTAPDISWIRAHYVEDLVNADAIYKMRHFMDGPNGISDSTLQDIYPALRQYASWQDTLYSMPMEATNLALIYNKDHFREVGLDPNSPPSNWQELRSYSRQLTRDLDGDGTIDRIGFGVPAQAATGPRGSYMMWQWIPFIWQAGGHLINEEQTRVLFAEPPGVQALTLWSEIYNMQNQKGFTNDYLMAFVSGGASMFLDGPWNLPRYPELLEGTDYGIAALPAGPEKRATVVAGEYLAIFKQSDHPEAAWAFIKWMIQPETQAFWSRESAYLPVRASVLDLPSYQEFLATHPGHKAFAEQMEYAMAQRPMDYNAVEIQRNLAIALEQATVGDRDPADALQEAANKSNQLLQQVAEN